MRAAIANPFDLKSVVLAQYAQHLVPVRFPIALFMIAAVATVPVLITGLWQLEGHKLKGVLLQHRVLGVASSLLIWVVWLIHCRAARSRGGSLPAYRLVIEVAGALRVALRAHRGGFLSGVNVPG